MTDYEREIMQQALEALENCASEHGHRCNRCDSEVDEGGRVIAALRAALAEPVQEPVANTTTLRAMLECCLSWEPNACVLGNVTARQAVIALRAALAEPVQVQEPVAWYFEAGLKRGVSLKQENHEWRPLYTAPPARRPLTDEEINRIDKSIPADMMLPDAKRLFARLIEQAHGITGGNDE